MRDPWLVSKVGAVLPTGVKATIRPIYDTAVGWAIAVADRLGAGVYEFEYEGKRYRIAPTTETGNAFLGLVRDGELVTEGVPLHRLTVGEDVDRIVDVGAHVGTYTVLLAMLNPQTPVVAYEPDDDNRETLHSVLAANGLGVSVRGEVVADGGGTVEFWTDPVGNSQGHSMAEREGYERVTKPSVALSEVVADDEHTWLKIDAEGAEHDILRDLFENTDADVEGIVELHPDRLATDVTEVLSLMDAHAAVEPIGDASPEHPAAAEIPGDTNRPLYYFRRVVVA